MVKIQKKQRNKFTLLKAHSLDHNCDGVKLATQRGDEPTVAVSRSVLPVQIARSRKVLEKLTVPDLANKFPAVYTRKNCRFITTCTYPKPVESIPSPYIILLQSPF
jgi:hypothetical protein